MEIQSKFNIGDIIYYVKSYELQKGVINGIKYVENYKRWHSDSAYTGVSYQGINLDRGKTKFEDIAENQVFSTLVDAQNEAEKELRTFNNTIKARWPKS